MVRPGVPDQQDRAEEPQVSRTRTVQTPVIPHASSLGRVSWGGFGRASGGLVPIDNRLEGSTGDQARVDDLVRRSLRWLVLVSISFRVGMTVPAAMLSRAVLGERVVPLAATVVVVDGVFAVWVWRRPGLLGRGWLFAADMVVTVAVTVGATLLVAPGEFLQAGPDSLTTGYLLGSVGLWTLARGPKTGAWFLAGFVALQFAFATVNGARFDSVGVANVAARCAYAMMIFVLMAALAVFARRSALLLVAQGMRAGRLTERAQALRSMHDTAIADFEAVILTADRAASPVADRLTAIAATAARGLTVLDHDARVTATRCGGLIPRLDLLVGEFGASGLTVDRVGEAGTGIRTLDSPVVDALEGAVRESLNNVVKHAGTCNAVVSVAEVQDTVQVAVADSGRGFAPEATRSGFGLSRSITQRVTDVGGQAQVLSAPDRGTRIVLTVPAGKRRDQRPPPERTEPVHAAAWLPLLPLTWRILALPVIALMVGSFTDGSGAVIAVVIGSLLVGNIGLIVTLIGSGGPALVRSWVLLGVDIAVAVGLFLWTATLVPAGTILSPNADIAWMYVVTTVAFWTAARGIVVGAALLAGSSLIIGAAVMVNSTTGSPGSPILVVWHLLNVLAVACGAVLIRRMSRGSADRTMAESRSVGGLLERVQVLDRLQHRVATTWNAIVTTTAASPPTQDSLREVRGLAMGIAGELRATLRADRNRAALSLAIDDVAGEARRAGVRVELVVTEQDGDPPPQVVTALVTATRKAMQPTIDCPGSVVLRVTGSVARAEVSIRDHADRPTVASTDLRAVMASVGGSADVQQPPSGGRRIQLRWPVS
jgi:signal transduction histidine kinase